MSHESHLRACQALEKAGHEVVDLLKDKNSDYGDDNLREYGRFGILVRLSDKVKRLKHMYEKKEMAIPESERDAWMDIAGYALQAIRFMNEEGA